MFIMSVLSDLPFEQMAVTTIAIPTSVARYVYAANTTSDALVR